MTGRAFQPTNDIVNAADRAIWDSLDGGDRVIKVTSAMDAAWPHVLAELRRLLLELDETDGQVMADYLCGPDEVVS